VRDGSRRPGPSVPSVDAAPEAPASCVPGRRRVGAPVQRLRVAKWLSRLPWPFTSASAQTLIAEAAADLERGRDCFLRVETRVDGTFVGTVSQRLPAYDAEPWTADTRLGIVGYAVVPDQQGRGFATEAASSIVQLAFEDMQIHRHRATALRDNVASRRVLERLGFRIRYTDVMGVPRYSGPPRLGDTFMLESVDWHRSDGDQPAPTGAP